MTDNNITRGLVRRNLAGAHRYTVTAAELLLSPSGDGRLIARLLLVTDDKAARHIACELTQEAVAGLVGNAVEIYEATAKGQLDKIAQTLDVAQQVDDPYPPTETD